MGAFVVCGSVLLCKSASTGGMSGSLEKREEMCPPPRPRGVPPPTDSPRPPPRPCAGPPVVTRLPSTTRVPRLDFLALRCSWSLAGPREPAVVEESLNASSKVVIPVHGTMCSWMSLPQEGACILFVCACASSDMAAAADKIAKDTRVFTVNRNPAHQLTLTS